MSGYARRPGAPPLSRARSLVVPDAAAFYERRSCLPQLDCERPHGGDLHPHFFGIRPTFMCYVPSPVLASVGDTDFGYGKGKCTKQGPAGAHETHFGDDKLEDLEEANPFSFKEFLKTKNLGLTKDDTTNSRIYPKEASRHSLGLDHSSPTPQTVGYGLEYQQPFFEDPTGAGDIVGEEEEDEDSGWNGAYLPSAVEKTHSSRATASTSPCAGSPSAEFTTHGESLGDRHLRTLQISYEALKDENSKLRRKLNEVQSFSETQTEMVRTLERKLEAKMIKEESDYHDLESVVQQVEQNLELMTVRKASACGMGGISREGPAGPEKRAVKAENHVIKLKQEINLLQEIPSARQSTCWNEWARAHGQVHTSPPRAQVSNFKRENEALRSGQGASLTVVKQNTDVALQNLRVVMNSAHASIKQLVSGAETLNFVAEILKSIDRISEIKDEEEKS
ncbi:endosome-associated-trafficking regulator 1 isoform X5 [Ictidomys tridecemlineatus]